MVSDSSVTAAATVSLRVSTFSRVSPAAASAAPRLKFAASSSRRICVVGVGQGLGVHAATRGDRRSRRSRPGPASRRRGRRRSRACCRGATAGAARPPAAGASGSSTRTAASVRIRCRRASAGAGRPGPGRPARSPGGGGQPGRPDTRATGGAPSGNIRSVTRIGRALLQRCGALRVDVPAGRGDRRVWSGAPRARGVPAAAARAGRRSPDRARAAADTSRSP